MFLTRKLSFISGIICGLSFAPVYFLPGIFMLSVLCAQVASTKSSKQAAIFGYLFGFGFFLSTLYWIAFGVSVYIEQFWWAIPFALLGLPAFIALFVSAQAAISWQFRKSRFYHFLFCCIWLLMEWVISWIFTGLPWAALGYTLSISNILMQSASIFGVIGLSFVVVYIGSSLYGKNQLSIRLIVALIICIAMIIFGYKRLEQNPTEFSTIKARIVQASIPQTEKWSVEEFWKNLYKHIELSQKDGSPDIIVWSEAALTAPYYYKPIHDSLMSAFTKKDQILLSGGVNDNDKQGDDLELYSSLIALNNDGELIFDYHKSHLVPFGEYMPLATYLPVKKLTPGIIDYTPGKRETMYLKQFNLHIHPMICYESIFSSEVRLENLNADLIVNITNDAWYGNSSGPYQHFEISRMRSVENGLPMIRSANNGISAIIDPLGRVIKQLELNKVDAIDGYIPLKTPLPTTYSKLGETNLLFLITLIITLQSIVTFCLQKILILKNYLY